MAKPVKLSNGKTWKTQTAAKAHFKEILNGLTDGDRITEESHHSDLAALVQAYDISLPEDSRKAGKGIDHFYKDRDKEYNGMTSCFYVSRIDHTSIDFSYLRAVEVASKNVG